MTSFDLSSADEHDLLARLDARLTNEVVRLATANVAFAQAARTICKALPPDASVGRQVITFLSNMSIQLANAMLKDMDVPLLRDGGAEYLLKLGLRGDEFFRELEVDGRRFLAVALPDSGVSDELLNKLRTQIAELEQAAQAHDTNPGGTRLRYCAKDVQVTAKYIARLSKRCPTLRSECRD